MNELAIIIVFYKPTSQQIEQARFLAQGVFVIIVDNSNEKLNNFDGVSNIEYIPLLDNRGIAFAQNVGIKKAEEKEFKYVLFQDQDSSLNTKDIRILIEKYNQIKACDHHIAALGPVIFNQTTGQEYKSEIGKGQIKQVSSIISSGMLAETGIFSDVGYLEDALFIDNVDHEWCWRARSKGHHIYMTRDVSLMHSVGQKTTKLMGMQIIKSASSRTFFKFRNNIWLMKRSYVPFLWKVKTFFHMIIDYLMYMLSANYGRPYTNEANRGIKAGFSH